MKGVLRLCIQVLLILLLVSACSGGGDSGSSDPKQPQRSSDWDQMVWGQDNWK